MLNLNFLLMVHVRMFSCAMIQFISCLSIFCFHNAYVYRGDAAEFLLSLAIGCVVLVTSHVRWPLGCYTVWKDSEPEDEDEAEQAARKGLESENEDEAEQAARKSLKSEDKDEDK